MKKIATGLAVFLIAFAGLHAQTALVAIEVELDPYDAGARVPANAAEVSSVLESTLLGVFFDRGWIAFNEATQWRAPRDATPSLKDFATLANLTSNAKRSGASALLAASVRVSREPANGRIHILGGSLVYGALGSGTASKREFGAQSDLKLLEKTLRELLASILDQK